MAGPFQNPQLPSLQEPVIARSASPLSPSPIAGQPISFKTNVNRAKSKRWVEAKSYSYDGDDWGSDDEYDDEEEEEPPVPPLPSQRDRSRSSTRDPGSSAPSDVPRLGQERTRSPNLDDKSRSLAPDNAASTINPNPSQLQQPVQSSEQSESQSANPSQSAIPVAATDANSSKPLPFIRPADIYKQMQEAKEKEAQSEGSTKPSVDSADVERSTGDSTLDSAHEQNSESVPSAPSVKSQEAPIVSLPEVKRMSSYGNNFVSMSNPDKSGEPDAQNQPDTQEHSLHHNSSMGFRSAVNQAFDAPPTPSSTVGSVVRSGSESTSVISPILGTRGLEGEKTPTITEEPGESSDGRRTPTFQPGHRRDISTPTPDNSPARRPIVSDNSTAAEAGEVASTAPTDSPNHEEGHPDASPGGAQRDGALDYSLATSIAQGLRHNASLSTVDSPASAIRKDEDSGYQLGEQAHYYKEPTPLRIRSGQYFTQDGATVPPQVPPSMSTETSPQDTESDRLRKEIMRRLSPEGSPAPEPRPEPQREGTQSSMIPSEYESYWNDHPTASPISPGGTRQQEGAPTSEDTAAVPRARPKLKKRFSWESSSSEEAGLPVAPQTTARGPDLARSEQLAWSESNAAKDAVEHDGELPLTDMRSVDPRPISPSSLPSAREDQQVDPEAQQDAPGEIPSGVQPSQGLQEPPTTLKLVSIDESKLLGFRDILGVQSAPERVRLFEKTRHQFASLDSGLDNWIRRTADTLPEHSDLVNRNGNFPSDFQRPSPSRTKFSKLPSLGALSSHLDASQQSGATAHNRRPSGAPLGNMIKRQHMEQRGKEFLHSAGAIGGKAGGAAKGLLAKGKSKFLGGAADKGSQSSSSFTHRRSLQLPHMTFASASDSAASHDRSSQRDSVAQGTIPRLPSFRFQENQFSLVAEDVVNRGSPSEIRRGPDRSMRSLSLDATGSLWGRQPRPTDSATSRRSVDNLVSTRENRMDANGGSHITTPGLQQYESDTEESRPEYVTFSGEDESPIALWTAALENLHESGSILPPESQLDDSSENGLGPTDSQAFSPYSSPAGDNFNVDPDVRLPDGENENPASVGDADNADDSTQENFEGDIGDSAEKDEATPPEYSSRVEAADRDVPNEPPPAFPGTGSGTDYPPEKQGFNGCAGPYSHTDTSEETPRPRPIYRMVTEHEWGSVAGREDILRFRSHARSADDLLQHIALNQPHSQRPSIVSPDTAGDLPNYQQQQQHYPPRAREAYRSRSLDFNSLLATDRLFTASSVNTGSPRFAPRYEPALNQNDMPEMQPEIPSANHRSSPVSSGVGHLPEQRRQSGDINLHAPPTRHSFLSSTRNSIFSALSKQDSESLRSRNSISGNAAMSRADLSGQQTPVSFGPEPKADKGQSTKAKIKKLAKLHRLSLPVTDTKPPEGAKKGTLARISGFFGRSSSPAQQDVDERKRNGRRKSRELLNTRNPTTLHPPEQGSPLCNAYHISNSSRQSMGQPTITSGQEPAGFLGGHRLAKQRTSEHNILTGQYYAQNKPHTPSQSPHLYHPRPQHQQFASPSSTNVSAQSPPLGNTFSPSYHMRDATGEERPWSYTDELRIRSRSPISYSPQPDTSTIPSIDYSDPAVNLGIFQSVPNTERVGDQETPWNITLPGETQENDSSGHTAHHSQTRLQRSAGLNPPYSTESITSRPDQSRQGLVQQHYHLTPMKPSPTVNKTSTATAHDNETESRRFSFEPESDVARPSRENVNTVVPFSTHPHRDESAVINRTTEPVELPLRQDDSSEEIVMSSTAYPGQEWQPAGYGRWEHY
ncbi:hypothetical protein DTO195F2_5556 [Paecilomyces variotii]|nr:hypothetical protein DTO195F2_5556 [Paecilomyces variotii]KAJ9370225.1 hypothetical protein DTO282E5_5118 [Paecilomyces variotii]KAJ9402094.1 hypothetical protein DTO282F9_858 [Paecilomyces variotii]